MTINVRVSGTWQAPRPWVRVSGTWQGVREGWVKVAGVWQRFYQSALLDATMTVGTDGLDYYGYDSITPFGSMSGTTVASGTLRLLYDDDATPQSLLYINYASDPGATLFSSVTVNGVNRTSASASYFYGGGIAQWTWNGLLFGLNGVGSTNVLITP